MAVEAGAAPKSKRRKLIVSGVGIAVIAVVFVFVLPRIANYREVWDVVQDLTWGQIGLLVLATVANLATYAPPWQAALPGLGYRQGTVLTLASTASTYVAPGGAAVGMAASYAMLRGWHFRRPADRPRGHAHRCLEPVRDARVPDRRPRSADAAARAERAAGDGGGDRARGLRRRGRRVRGGALDAEARFKVGELARRISNFGLRLVRRGPVGWTGDSFVSFRHDAINLLRHRWHVLTLATLAGQLTVFLVLLVSLRVTGVIRARSA